MVVDEGEVWGERDLNGVAVEERSIVAYSEAVYGVLIVGSGGSSYRCEGDESIGADGDGESFDLL